MEWINWISAYISAVLWLSSHQSCNAARYTETTSETCDLETFNARCPYNQQILITKALYGHIKLGRCVGVDFGYFGCYSDIMDIISERCEGKQRCEISMPDEGIAATKTCVKGLSMYMEVSYVCIPSTVHLSGCNGLEATTKQQYLNSKRLPSCGSDSTSSKSVAFTAPENFKIKFKITRLNLGSNVSNDDYGYLDNGKSENVQILFPSDDEDTTVMISTGSDAQLILHDKVMNNILLIGFQATGCPDPKQPPYTYVNRAGDEVTVSCLYSEHTWSLQCIGTNWVGSWGNCTEQKEVTEEEIPIIQEETPVEQKLEEQLSREILYAIIIGATLFLCVVVITTGYVMLKRAEYHSKGNANIEMHTIVKEGDHCGSWTRNSNQGREQNNQPNVWQNTVNRFHVAEPNGTLSNNTQKYLILGQNYVNSGDMQNT